MDEGRLIIARLMTCDADLAKLLAPCLADADGGLPDEISGRCLGDLEKFARLQCKQDGSVMRPPLHDGSLEMRIPVGCRVDVERR